MIYFAFHNVNKFSKLKIYKQKSANQTNKKLLFTSIASAVLSLIKTNPDSAKADTISDTDSPYRDSNNNITSTASNNFGDDSNSATSTSENTNTSSTIEDSNTGNSSNSSTTNTTFERTKSPSTQEENVQIKKYYYSYL